MEMTNKRSLYWYFRQTLSSTTESETGCEAHT